VKQLTMLIGFLIIVAGVIGVATPDTLVHFGRQVVTPAGLNIVAVLRVVIGLVLILAASRSRMPTTLRVVGAVIFIAGIATPFFGVDRARVILNWGSAQGPMLIRLVGVLAVAAGSFLVYAVTSTRDRI